ncbi:hypothetical protein G6M26_30710 [Agrobacterium tumefaciens]|nr:hypothetical protein [Agrobacterium tumefaciens]NTE22923.1 hypothetical protein [Agrobacterium tumefaciens]
MQSNENLESLILKIKNCDFSDESVIEKILYEFEKIPREEWTKYRVKLLSDNDLSSQLLRIAEKYSTNSKLLINVISSIGNMMERYNLLVSDEIFDFFLKHKDDKGIAFYISLFITKMPQFDLYKDRWEYILAIPKIPPKKKSMNLFLQIIKNTEIEIPSQYRSEIAKKIQEYLLQNEVSEYTRKLYLDTIDNLFV